MTPGNIQKAIHQIFEKKGMPFLVILVGGLFILESKFALRKRKISRWQRYWTNSKMAAVAAAGFRYLLIPAQVAAAMHSSSRKAGILHHLNLLPKWLRLPLGFLLLDYGNYTWHALNHYLPVLWRFHQVHHSDLDLDLSTAFRFHLGEIIPSVIYRGGVIWMIGLPWRGVLLYEILFEAANNFHHSNIKLPSKLHYQLSKLIVTPAMHGIHHSIVKEETGSNFSVIFTFWDSLHKTLKLDIPQEELNIGMPSYRDLEELKIKDLLVMPFKKVRDWKFPDGSIPSRDKLYIDNLAIKKK
ncbi:sterol desaturase family protein [soil metagenome]